MIAKLMTWKKRLKEYKASCSNYDQFVNYWENHACVWCRSDWVWYREIVKEIEWWWTMTRQDKDYLCLSCKQIPTAVRAVNKRFPEWQKFTALYKQKSMRNLANRGYLYLRYVSDIWAK